MSEQFNPMALPIAERNKWFQGLTKRERAVAIAKDTLAQLDARKYTAEIGEYFDFTEADIRAVENLPLQVVLETESCNVCAIGASYASIARLGNDINTRDVLNPEGLMAVEFSETLTDKTIVAFTNREMRAMEVVFEGCQIASTFSWDDEHTLKEYRKGLFDKAPETVNRYSAPEVAEYLLRTIMQNVIDNEGRFLVRGVKLSTTKPHKW